VLVGSCDKVCKLLPKEGSIIVGEGENCEYKDTTGGGGGEQPVGDPVVLTSPITTNTTLKDLGLPIDYVWKGSGSLYVQNNAVLTIEPGVTIQFTNTGGGIEIKDGAAIKAIGTADKRIQFVGTGTNKGSWGRFWIETVSDNEFMYCDFINGGSYTSNSGVLYLTDKGRLAISHSKISGSLYAGIWLWNCATVSEIYKFDNNIIENCNEMPVFLTDIRFANKFDETSNLTNNGKNYVQVSRAYTTANLTLNATSVPYYVTGAFEAYAGTFTVNEGVTFYLATDVQLRLQTDGGVMIANGTPEKPVKFTHLPDSPAYWKGVWVYGTEGHVFNNVIFEYGGSTDSNPSRANFYIHNNGTASVTLNNVVFRNSQHYGLVRVGEAAITHSNVTFENNPDGNVLWSDGVVYTQIP
jgi:hypothetical protein